MAISYNDLSEFSFILREVDSVKYSNIISIISKGVGNYNVYSVHVNIMCIFYGFSSLVFLL